MTKKMSDPLISWEITESTPTLFKCSLPLRIFSESNDTAHWRLKHRRGKRMRNWVLYAMRDQQVKLPAQVEIIRLAPRMLDSDNLVSACKVLIDAIAAALTGDYRPGRADGYADVTWIFRQEKSDRYGVQLTICALSAAVDGPGPGPLQASSTVCLDRRGAQIVPFSCAPETL